MATNDVDEAHTGLERLKAEHQDAENRADYSQRLEIVKHAALLAQSRRRGRLHSAGRRQDDPPRPLARPYSRGRGWR